MLTPKDIENAKTQSGYDHVTAAVDSRPGRTNPSPYYARAHGPAKPGGSGGAKIWQGPRRVTAIESAQDYCDYANSGSASAPVTLKSAGHVGAPRKTPTEDPKLAEARMLQREALSGAAIDPSGWIYLIGEVGRAYAAKIGQSREHPRHRLAGLQTGNPRVLEVIGCYKVKDRDAEERALHSRFIEHNVLGEWFRITTDITNHFKERSEAESEAA